MSYAELLKHPMWQRKRLEVLQHEDFSCSVCCGSDATLHVHHRRYLKGHKPWEYEQGDLVTLCEECHEEAHSIKDKHVELLAHIHPMHDKEMLAAATAFSIGLPVGCPLPKGDVDRIREAAPLAYTAGCIAALSLDLSNPQATMDALLRAFLARERGYQYEWDMLQFCYDYLKGRGAKAPQWAIDGLRETGAQIEVKDAA